MEKDMTEGSPLKLILFFSLPLFLGNIFQQIYSMVDTIVVGRFVGIDALAALGAVGGFCFMVLGFSQGLGNGFAVLVSQNYGAKDYAQMRKSYAMSILSSLVIGVIISIIFFSLSKVMLLMINTPDNIIEMSNSYTQIIYLGLLASIYYNLFASILRAVGDSKSPVIFLLLSSFLNVILDIVLVLIIPLGCRGVAIATIFSQAISALISYVYISKKLPVLRLTRESWKVDYFIIRKLLRIGLPGAIQFSICALGVIILQMSINSFGSDVVAAFSVGNKVENMLAQYFSALGMAISTYSAQNLGSCNYNRIKRGFNMGLILVALWSLISYILSKVITKPLIYLFLQKDAISESLILNASTYVNICTLFFIPLGLIFLYRTGCQGLGSGLIPMISSITELLFRFIASLSLPICLGYLGICLVSPTAWVAAGVILPICYILQMKKIKKQLQLPNQMSAALG